jgi:hypothetical protein
VIEGGGSQDHAGLPHSEHSRAIRPLGPGPAAVAPGPARGIEPAPVGQAIDNPAVRAAALLADAAGPLETGEAADLRLINRIKPAQNLPRT